MQLEIILLWPLFPIGKWGEEKAFYLSDCGVGRLSILQALVYQISCLSLEVHDGSNVTGAGNGAGDHRELCGIARLALVMADEVQGVSNTSIFWYLHRSYQGSLSPQFNQVWVSQL